MRDGRRKVVYSGLGKSYSNDYTKPTYKRTNTTNRS